MNTFFTLALLTIVCLALSARGKKHDWENQTVIGRNKLPAHCTLIPFANINNALKGNIKSSVYYKSLNGNWKFHWVKNPEKRPVDFYNNKFDDSNWKSIPVPSN